MKRATRELLGLIVRDSWTRMLSVAGARDILDSDARQHAEIRDLRKENREMRTAIAKKDAALRWLLRCMEVANWDGDPAAVAGRAALDLTSKSWGKP